jgi:hypothetical protein
VIHYTLATDLPHTKHYEFAAWFTKGTVKAGTYEAEAHFSNWRYDKAAQVTVALPGIVTEDNFQSHFGGLPAGQAYDETKNAGKDVTFSTQVYGYQVAESIIHDANSRWAVDDDWVAKCDKSPDGACATHSLLRVE